MTDLLSMDQKEMIQFVSEHGFPAFRGKQLYQWCQKKEVFHFEEMTNLPRNFLNFLKAECYFERGILVDERLSEDGETVKFLLRFGDEFIETVLMRYDRKNARNRNTLCVSTQAGCAMGCKFCATGQGGLRKNLSAGAIINQVHFANDFLRKRHEEPVSNIVYMGMGEPFQNYDAVVKSIRVLNDAKEIGMRRITVSTCGLIPEIRQLATENMQINLAVSLHGATNEVRSSLMPINKKYPLESLMATLDDYIEATGRRVTIEYALFEKVNDSLADAGKLADLIEGKLYHVNIVPGNPVEGTRLFSSSQQRIEVFVQQLEKRHISVSIRESKGRDVEGACGQLRAHHKKMKKI